MIHFYCRSCLEPLEVADELAGQRIKCRHCDKPQKAPLSGAEEPPKMPQGFSRAVPAKRRRSVFLVLEVTRLSVWLGCLFWASAVAVAYFGQTGSAAPDACFWVIACYVAAARSTSLSASWKPC